MLFKLFCSLSPFFKRKKQSIMIQIVEKLTVLNGILQIVPKSLFCRSRKIYFIDATFLARHLFWFARPIDFRMINVRDEKGLLFSLRAPSSDLFELERKSPLYHWKGPGRLKTFLEKKKVVVGVTDLNGISRALFLVQMVVCKRRENQEWQDCSLTLWLRRRTDRTAIMEAGFKNQMEVFFLLPMFSFQLWRRPWVVYGYQVLKRLLWLCRHFQRRGRMEKATPTTEPKVAVDFYGQFNLEQPELYSDFFFYQRSGLQGKYLAPLFHIPADPLDDEKLKVMRQQKMSPLLLNPHSSKTSALIPAKPPRPIRISKKYRLETGDRLEKREFRKGVAEYQKFFHYWQDLFSRHHHKLYLSWFKYDGMHCAIADAMESVGGLTALYQRALDVTPYVSCRMNTDIAFGYSAWMADFEKQVGSTVKQYIITGYLGDHRFSLLKEFGEQLRKEMHQKGAEFIVAYTDENSLEDARWHTGHELMRGQYRFILEKIISDPKLGLILKPKTAKTLRERLGWVNPLLDSALKTGRCLLLDKGALYGAYPPALAAMAADVMIHGHLCAPTAALEGALVGKPTLLFDGEGWSASPLYQLGVGDVVFTDWEVLWRRVLEYRKNPTQDTRFGCWVPLMEKIDPFRDGKGAWRMGNYVSWLMDSFAKGESRENALSVASERYQKEFGADKVVSIS